MKGSREQQARREFKVRSDLLVTKGQLVPLDPKGFSEWKEFQDRKAHRV